MNSSKSLSVRNPALQSLKNGIWIYFFLLLFEGAFRKWLLPGLANPLLIVRDPIAIWLLLKAIQKGILPFKGYVAAITLISIVAFITTLLLGHQNPYVALFGLRILLIHFPLMFVIGRVFTKEDVIHLGKITIYICIPMLILNVLQFYSPQSAWVNRGVGGDMAGAGFSGALDFFRPPGTFSFTTGNVLFWGYAAPFVFYFWLVPQQINRFLLIGGTVSLILAIPLSISRTLLFEVALTFLFTLVIMIRKPKYLGRIAIAVAVLFLLIVAISKTSIFQTGSEAFTSRFTSANESEGGLESVFLDRFLGGMIGAVTQSDEIPFFGYGIGMGTNVGSMLLSGKVIFLIAEVEWGRLIGEMGILLGLTVIAIRIAFVFKVTKLAYKKLRYGDFLPWLLLSFGMLVLLQGQWAQPTSLGFSTLIGGLILASVKNKRIVNENGAIN